MLFPLHPLAYLAIQKSTVILLLAFTPPDSLLRYALFPVLVVCNYCLTPSYTLYIPRSPWIAFIAAEVLMTLLGYIEKLLLSQWSFEDRGPSAEINKQKFTRKEQSNEAAARAKIEDRAFKSMKSDKHKGSGWDRLKFGTWVAISNRYIGSPYQARNVPPYSTTSTTYIPTRRSFLVRRGCIFLTCYLFADLMIRVDQPDRNAIVFAEKYVPFFMRLGNVGADEMFTRLSTTLGYWIGAYTVLQAYYSAMAFVAVSSGLDSPVYCRPVFGSLSDAYTIRGFWG